MIQYKKIYNELKHAPANRTYKLPKDPNIMKQIVKNPSKENMKKLYKNASMKNADEYEDKLYLQTTLMFDFLKKHPEITKLAPSKKQEVIKALLAG